jgi:hypothetical protein
VTWNFAARAATPVVPPLSTSERRDSILKAVRAPQVLDSLTKAKFDSVAIARAKVLLAPAPAGGPPLGGRAGGGGGRGGGVACERPLFQGDQFCARPAEGAVQGGGGRGGADPAADPFGGGRGGGGPESAAVQKIFQLIGLRVPGGGGRGGGGGGRGGGGGGNIVGTGEYLVTMTVGGQTYRQVLKVERVSGGDDAANPFGSDERLEQLRKAISPK